MKMRNLILAAATLAGFSAAAAPEALARNALFAVLNGGNECNAASPPTCRIGDLDGVGRGTETFNGGVVVTLAPPFNNGGGTPGTSMMCNNTVPAAIITLMRSDPQEFYINVHNAAFPGGAVRGQLF